MAGCRVSVSRGAVLRVSGDVLNLVLDFLRWWIPWQPSVIVVVGFALTTWLYWRGARRAPMTAPWRRQLLFWTGLLLLYVGLHTRLDYYAEFEFFVHRIQQLGLQHLGPFLIVMAYPGATLRKGLPLSWRKRAVGPLMRSAPVRWLLHPFTVTALFVGLMLFWLWPPVHFYSMLDWRLYRLMNWSMVVTGLLYWWLILDTRPKPPARLSPGMRVLVEMLVMVPQIVVGAYITLVGRDLYPIYSLCGRAFASITPATDQYLGGLILWIPTSMMSALGALIAFAHWIRLDSKGRLPRNRRQCELIRARQAAAARSREAEALADGMEKSI
jgi:putative membrane protein